jgi:hypothetical protein
MSTRIPPLGPPQTESESQPDGYRARAAQCQAVADRWTGLIKRQYEDLARLWLTVAELAERKVSVTRR